MCGGFSEFLVVEVLKAQQFSSVRLSRLRLYDGRGMCIRLYDGSGTEATRVNAEAATFRQERGEIFTDILASLEVEMFFTWPLT